MHFRAPPDVRGSGKERGHGTELKFCPKCGKELKPGKHHVGCSAGKSAPRQAAKRQRQMSSTTESDWVSQTSTASLGDEQSDSWEDTVRRRVSKVQKQRSVEETISRRNPQGQYGNSTGGVGGRAGDSTRGFAPEDVHCRVNRMQQMLTEGDHNAELVFTANTMADVGLILRHGGGGGGGGGGDALNRKDGTASPSPSLAKLLDAADAPVDLATIPLMRVPSPPPLPPDWDAPGLGGGGGGGGGGGHTSLLFDFDQFDVNRRNTLDGLAEPIMTVTSAMNPLEMSNPSDDYIWQIMFAGENEVPRRVTAHLHHVESDANDDLMLKLLDDEEHHEHRQQAPVYDEGIKWVDPAVAAVTTNIISGNAVTDGGGGGSLNRNGNGNGSSGPGNGSMQPPPSRSPIAPILLGPDGLANLPPPPTEALAAAEHAQQPQTITVTYVVQPGSGPEGQRQYAVKSIHPAVENNDNTVEAAVAPEQQQQQQQQQQQ